MEVDGASDRKMYSEIFKFLPQADVPKLCGGLKYVQRGAFYAFVFQSNVENYKSNMFSVMPMSEADIWEKLRSIKERHGVNNSNYKKAEMEEIEGLEYNKKYDNVPEQKWGF